MAIANAVEDFDIPVPPNLTSIEGLQRLNDYKRCKCDHQN